MAYGVRLKGSLDMSLAKSMILLEVVNIDSGGNLTFSFGDLFTDVGSKQIGAYGFNAQYILKHNHGSELVAVIKGSESLSAHPETGVYGQGAVYASVLANNINGDFMINFINNYVPPTRIKIYGAIKNIHKDTNYGMNIYDASGDVTFSTQRPILGDMLVEEPITWVNKPSKVIAASPVGVLSKFNDFYLSAVGFAAADKYLFSPYLTADNMLITGLSGFQGNSAWIGQADTPTYDYMINGELIAF